MARMGVALILAGMLLLSSGCVRAESSAARVDVLAAASLADLLTAASHRVATLGLEVCCQFSASSEGRRQVEHGARGDLYVSADSADLDLLERRDLLVKGTRRPLFGNRLVLVQPAHPRVLLGSSCELTAPEIRRIAIGEPGTVPAGRYAQQAFQTLGMSKAIAPRLVLGTHVRVVLDWVVRGEVDAAVVYATDADVAGDRVRRVGEFPATSHDPVVYCAAVLKEARHPEPARRFLSWLAGKKGLALARVSGFTDLSDTLSRPDGSSLP